MPWSLMASCLQVGEEFWFFARARHECCSDQNKKITLAVSNHNFLLVIREDKYSAFLSRKKEVIFGPLHRRHEFCSEGCLEGEMNLFLVSKGCVGRFL